MSIDVCPRCQGPLPENVRRDLAKGTTCPFCSLVLKEGPRPAAALRPDAGYASFQVNGGAALAVKPAPLKAPQALNKTMVGVSGSARAPQFEATPAPAPIKPAPPAAAPARAPAAPPPPAAPPARAPAAPPPVSRLSPRAPAAVAPLVTESESGPTSVSAPLALNPATVTPLRFPDPEPVAAVTLVPDPPEPPPAAILLPEPAAPTRRVVLGIGMGLGIVALLVVGVSAMRRPKPQAAPAVPAPVAAQEPVPTAPAAELAPPAPAPEAAAPPRAAKPATAEPVAQTGGSRGAHKRAVTAHHGKAHRATRTRKVAMRERTPKPEVAPSAPAERPDPRAPYERGNKLLFSGDGKGAIAAYREAVKAAPKDPIGFRGLGLAYEHEGEAAKAIKSLRRYLKLAPNAADHDLIVRRIDRLSKAPKK